MPTEAELADMARRLGDRLDAILLSLPLDDPAHTCQIPGKGICWHHNHRETHATVQADGPTEGP